MSIFDTNIEDEDESLLQVINHGPIHKADFLANEVVYALSHDEQFSIHSIASDVENSPPPQIFGDVRPLLHCNYVIDVLHDGENGIHVAAGSLDR